VLAKIQDYPQVGQIARRVADVLDHGGNKVKALSGLPHLRIIEINNHALRVVQRK
jgi:hypothetical protein